MWPGHTARQKEEEIGTGGIADASHAAKAGHEAPSPSVPEQTFSPDRARCIPCPVFPLGGCAMLKHRGFPGRLPGTDFQFTIRRDNKAGATKLIARERFADRKPADRRADAGFMEALWMYFGDEPFERGNLDAGRLSWLFGREVVPATDPFDPADYEALLQIDEAVARASFPDAFEDEWG